MMKHLLNIEYRKVANYNAFKILLLGYLVAVVGLFLSLHNFSLGPLELFGQETLKFPYVWQNVAFIGKYFNLGLGILVILLIGNEFSFNTARQNVIDGLRRHDLVVSKYLVVLLLVAVSVLIMAIIGVLLGVINSVNYNLSLMVKDTGYLLGFGAHTFALLSLAAFIAYLFRKTAIAILFFLSYAVFVEAIFRGIIDAGFTKYFPSKSINSIINTPYVEIVAQMSENSDITLQTSPWNEFLPIAVAYGIIFFILSIVLVKRRNL